MADDALPTLTTSSFAVLSLLCLQPWSAYELAQQMERSLGWYWPRAASGVYQEPKKLVAHGYATAERQQQGRRERTVYEVTEAGRRAMAAWLAEPPTDGPTLHAEQLVRCLMPDAGTRDQLAANVATFRDQLQDRLDALDEQLASYGRADAPFPHRRYSQALAGELLVRHLGALRDWAEWALDEIDSWPAGGWSEASEGASAALRRLIDERPPADG